jgi:S1-C subfamily serine protease
VAIQSREQLMQMAKLLGGMLVLDCFPGGPAATAGIRFGDIILEVNGLATPGVDAYLEAIERSRDVKIRLFRDGLTIDTGFERRPSGQEVDLGGLLAQLLDRRVLPG